MTQVAAEMVGFIAELPRLSVEGHRPSQESMVALAFAEACRTRSAVHGRRRTMPGPGEVEVPLRYGKQCVHLHFVI